MRRGYKVGAICLLFVAVLLFPFEVEVVTARIDVSQAELPAFALPFLDFEATNFTLAINRPCEFNLTVTAAQVVGSAEEANNVTRFEVKLIDALIEYAWKADGQTGLYRFEVSELVLRGTLDQQALELQGYVRENLLNLLGELLGLS